MKAAAGSTSSAPAAPIFTDRADASITPASDGNCAAKTVVGDTFPEATADLTYLLLRL